MSSTIRNELLTVSGVLAVLFFGVPNLAPTHPVSRDVAPASASSAGAGKLQIWKSDAGSSPRGARACVEALKRELSGNENIERFVMDLDLDPHAEGTLVATVSPDWQLLPEPMQDRMARSLWYAWARSYDPEVWTSARLRLEDGNGKSLGGWTSSGAIEAGD